MSDAWVEIHHPDGRDGYVTQFAYDVLWSRKGFLPSRRGTTAEESPADDVEVVISGGEPTEAEVEDQSVDEVEVLRERLRAVGIRVDKRWGLKRLRTEAATLSDEADVE